MLSVDIRGQGIPLVFLHAYPLNRNMWKGDVDFFSRHFKVVTMDFPGFGSTPPDLHLVTISMSELADQVLATLDANGIKESAIFVGLSMGGYVAFRLWEKAPERFRAMVLSSTRAAADTDVVRARRMKTIEVMLTQGVDSLPDIMKPALFGKTALATKHELIHKISQDILTGTVDGICGVLRGMAERPDSTDLLTTIKVPTLVLSGTEDTVVPTEEMHLMADSISDSEFHAVSETGHLLNLESPAVFHDKISHFLKRHVL